MRALEIYTDGACQGNPGPAAIGIVIKENGSVLKKYSRTIGMATNNIAEYTALVIALQEALILKADEVIVHTDSELMHNQIRGLYKIKHPQLKPLFDQVQHLAKGFQKFDLRHVGREHNQDADRLAKNAIKTEQAKVVASPPEAGGRKVRAPQDNAS